MDSQRGSRITEFETGRRQDGSEGIFRGYADLVLVAVLTLGTVGIVFVFGEQGGPSWLRVPLGFLFVFVLPGYALTSALLPRTTVGPTHSFTVGTVERLVLAVGLSLAVVPLISIGLTMVGVAIGFQTVLYSLSIFIAVTLLVAVVRTYRAPPESRFSLFSQLPRSLDGQGLAANKATVVFGVALLLAAGGLAVALVGSDAGDTYSELTLQATDDDGDPTPAAYPETLSLDEPEPLYVEIENHEHRSVDYTVVVLLEEIESDEVIDRTELDRFDVTLGHSERTAVEHELQPVRTGESLRISYLLYTDPVPDQPTVSNADQSVHFFSEVTDDS